MNGPEYIDIQPGDISTLAAEERAKKSRVRRAIELLRSIVSKMPSAEPASQDFTNQRGIGEKPLISQTEKDMHGRTPRQIVVETLNTKK